MYQDNCFYVQRPIIKVDDEGREYEANDEVHIRFNMGRNFARAYYRDELKSKGLNPDFKLSINGRECRICNYWNQISRWTLYFRSFA